MARVHLGRTLGRRVSEMEHSIRPAAPAVAVATPRPTRPAGAPTGRPRPAPVSVPAASLPAPPSPAKSPAWGGGGIATLIAQARGDQHSQSPQRRRPRTVAELDQEFEALISSASTFTRTPSSVRSKLPPTSATSREELEARMVERQRMAAVGEAASELLEDMATWQTTTPTSLLLLSCDTTPGEALCTFDRSSERILKKVRRLKTLGQLLAVEGDKHPASPRRPWLSPTAKGR
mmetsp:Transcript_67127/g.143634  ORF Transcript_67127/g.143634 Transcript_67127/m.143634 type:complete len:234 (+) Transcript_67127:36-737(+)